MSIAARASYFASGAAFIGACVMVPDYWVWASILLALSVANVLHGNNLVRR